MADNSFRYSSLLARDIFWARWDRIKVRTTVNTRMTTKLVRVKNLASLKVWRSRPEPHQEVFNLLVGSMLAAIMAEVAFTAYVNVYSGVSAFGHFLRLVSFYLVYKAIVETGLIRPQAVLFHNLAESEERLRQQARELQIRNDELDAFAHTVAHDLKGPLGLMVGFADMLMDGYRDMPPAAIERALLTVTQSGVKAGRIIESLLLLASIRQQDAQLEPIDMSGVIDEVGHPRDQGSSIGIGKSSRGNLGNMIAVE